jgi:hypothetical protein
MARSTKSVLATPEGENVLALIEDRIARHVWVTKEQRLTAALWILHTYIFEGYRYTPRLAVLSPAYGGGKTDFQILIRELVQNPARYINVSAALIYQLLEDGVPRTLILDEGDNQNFLKNPLLRAVLNGNRRGDQVGRGGGKGGVRDYPTFTPILIAARGRLPDALTQRSIVINMAKAPSDLEKFDEIDPTNIGAMALLRDKIQEWLKTCELDSNPSNPFKNRRADNWRPLFSIADYFGRGKEARAAALKLSAGLPDEDPKVILLADIRSIFDTLGVDRIWSALLLERLHDIEGGLWSEWCGPKEDQQPHKLTATEMARLLRDFGIHPRTMSQLGSRGSRGPSARGYFRQDFEAAWASWCTT